MTKIKIKKMMPPRLRRPRMKSHTVVGAPPGTLMADPNAAKPVIRVMAYGQDEYTEAEITELESVREYLERWPVTWVNIDGLGDVEIIRQIGDMFNLHRLALEDVVNVHQRPKVEQYGDHLFLVVRMIEEGLPVRTEQLSIFVGGRFVVTFQEHIGDCLDIVRKRIREGLGRVRNMGADYLAYSLADAVVDAYYPHLDGFSDRVEDLEAEVLAQPSTETVSGIHQMKRDLLAIRHVMSPLREAINTMFRDGGSPITDATRLYLRDCYDHVIRILEMVEIYREIVGGLLDVYLSSVSNRMNEVMKMLTIIATIFIPLSFVAGVYGMNFDTGASPLNMPELRWYWGYPAFLVLVSAIAGLELWFFWRKGWLGGDALKREGSSKRRSDKTNDGQGGTK